MRPLRGEDPEQARSIRAGALAFVFDAYQRKAAGTSGGVARRGGYDSDQRKYTQA